MAGMWRTAMSYLGLGPDEDYDDYEPVERVPPAEAGPSRPRPRPPQGSSPQRRRPDPEEGDPVVRVLPGGGDRDREMPRDRDRERDPDRGRQRDWEPERERVAPPPRRPSPQTRVDEDPEDDRGRERSRVRTMPTGTSSKPLVVEARGFNDAPKVADVLKKRQPVIMNLDGVPRDIARRLIDFASGLCYALDGSMEKVSSQVYLLTPSVPDPDRRKLQPRAPRPLAD